MAPRSSLLSFALKGPAGEPVDFQRAALSHGLTSVAPFEVTGDGERLASVVRLPGGSTRLVEMSEGPGSICNAEVSGPELGAQEIDALTLIVKQILALDSDLSAFYRDAAGDSLLGWACRGAGRFVRSQTIFEDLIRTICTTNCSFSATRRMLETSVAELGERAEPTERRAFPTPDRIARVGDGFFRDRARAGYRAGYIVSIARDVAGGNVDLEALRPGAEAELDDDEAYARLLELPGVGPYAASHAMMLMGRYSRPVLDSWSRPAFVDATGEAGDDRTIRSRFERFGSFAGLAFWLVVTRSWIASSAAAER